MSKNKIPSEADFARAKAARRYYDRGLSDVYDRLFKRFNKRGVDRISIFYCRDSNTFGAYVFYLTDRMIVEGKESGLSSEIEEAVYEELTTAGRGGSGDQNTLDVSFEFDSYENVEQNYDGDYFDRLR
ncbi:MAG: hypothetical protein QM501_13460 [Gimesia sp.]